MVKEVDNRGGADTQPRDGNMSAAFREERGERLGPVRKGETCRKQHRTGEGSSGVRGPLGGPWLPPGGKWLRQKGGVISDSDTRRHTAFHMLPRCEAPENYHVLRNAKIRILRHLFRCPHGPRRARGCSFLDTEAEAQPMGGPPSPECPAPAEKASGSPVAGVG